MKKYSFFGIAPSYVPLPLLGLRLFFIIMVLLTFIAAGNLIFGLFLRFILKRDASVGIKKRVIVLGICLTVTCLIFLAYKYIYCGFNSYNGYCTSFLNLPPLRN